MTRRVAIIGPDRRRTGTGPFVAEFLRRSGCSVLCWDRAAAAQFLNPGFGRPGIDAVAICSPAETHIDYLGAAVSKGLHVFCEKPIGWPLDQSCSSLAPLIQKVDEALECARDRGLVVHENTQWVYTLPDFQHIAGEFTPGRVSHFRCELSPSSGTPAEMLMECSAHANALLIRLGCSGVQAPQVSFRPGRGDTCAALEIDFGSRGLSGHPVQVEYRFAQQTAQPRHAAYEIDHRRVERRVDIRDYRIFLKHESLEREIRDPLESSVEDFLNRIARPAPDCVSGIPENIRMSYHLLAACARFEELPDA